MMLISVNKLQLKAKLFRGLADPTRLNILETLRNGDKTVTEIVLKTKQSQSNISNHLSCLLGCGLVRNRRDGKNIRYSLSHPEVFHLLEHGDDLLAQVAENMMQCVRDNE